MVSYPPAELSTNGYTIPPDPVVGIFSPRPASSPATEAYEHYLRLPELYKLWTTRDFPSWTNEPLLKPSLQALEITFRFISVVLSDPRPYTNRREWARRLTSLASNQIELISGFCRRDTTNAPTSDLRKPSAGLSTRDKSEVWIPFHGAGAVVSRTSEASLLPRLAKWETSEEVASKIMLQIESHFCNAAFTLGIGEPNLAGKPNLEYDLVCRAAEVHGLKKSPVVKDNPENETVLALHQIMEAWVLVGKVVLDRIEKAIEASEWEKVAEECWSLERIWKLVAEVEELHVVMDPDDLLRLIKKQLLLDGSSPIWFRSVGLMELTRKSKDLKREVPVVVGVEVDPRGGPRVQEAAMRLFQDKSIKSKKVEVFQSFQAVEAAVKKFFFAYRQVIVSTMGSPEVGRFLKDDPLTRLFSEPPYFPSLDAAKTFLGDQWNNNNKMMTKKKKKKGFSGSSATAAACCTAGGGSSYSYSANGKPTNM